MSRDVRQQNEVELRERRNMAGGLSAFEKQAAMTDGSVTIYERMALEGSRAASPSSSMASLSSGLSMPPIEPSLPGVRPNEMFGVIRPQIPRPELSMYNPVSSGSAPASSNAPSIAPPNFNSFASFSNDSSGAFSPSFKAGGDTFSPLSLPPAKAPESTLNPLAPGPETGPFQHAPTPPPTAAKNETNPEKPSMLENMASSLGQVNPGNLLQDVKRSVNPVMQFAKEIFQLVTGSIFAFLNFFFKPPVK